MESMIEKRIRPYSGGVERIQHDGKQMLVFRGRSIVYGQYSDPIMWFKEIIDEGAAARAIRECDVRSNQNHDSNFILGRTTSRPVGPNGEHSLVLREDKEGVHVVNYPPDTSYARDLAELLDRGEINQMSFQFRIPRDGDDWEGTVDEPIRRIHEIYPLIDVAYVAFPAYPQTSATVESVSRDAGINFDDLRRVYAKTKLRIAMTRAEAKLAENVCRWIDAFSSGGHRCGSACKLITPAGRQEATGGEQIKPSEQELEKARVRMNEDLSLQMSHIKATLGR